MLLFHRGKIGVYCNSRGFLLLSPTKLEGYSFGGVRLPFRPSVRPHFLSVRNHISVPIGQI